MSPKKKPQKSTFRKAGTKSTKVGKKTRKATKKSPLRHGSLLAEVALEQGLQIPAQSVAYLAALLTHGFFEGTLGNQELSSEVAPLVAALHQVLAGGTAVAPVAVNGPINGTVVAQLNALLAGALQEVNIRNGPGDVNVFFG